MIWVCILCKVINMSIGKPWASKISNSTILGKLYSCFIFYFFFVPFLTLNIKNEVELKDIITLTLIPFQLANARSLLLSLQLRDTDIRVRQNSSTLHLDQIFDSKIDDELSNSQELTETKPQLFRPSPLPSFKPTHTRPHRTHCGLPLPDLPKKVIPVFRNYDDIPTESKHVMTPSHRIGTIKQMTDASLHTMQAALLNFNPRLAFNIYRQLDPMEISNLLTSEDYSLILESLCQHSRPKLAARHAGLIWKAMRDNDIHLTVRDYTMLMTIFARNQDLQRVVYTWDDMHRFGIEPNMDTWYLLITAYGRTGKLSEAQNTFNEMNKYFSQPVRDPVAYAILIDACARNNDLDAALEVRQNMIKLGIKPDRRVYEAMIRAYGNVNKLTNARDLFAGMKRIHDLTPTPETYDVIIEIHAQANDSEWVWHYWNELISSSSMSPLAETLSKVLHVAAKDKDLSLILSLWNLTKHGSQGKKGLVALPDAFMELIWGLLYCGLKKEGMAVYNYMIYGRMPTKELMNTIEKLKQEMDTEEDDNSYPDKPFFQRKPNDWDPRLFQAYLNLSKQR